MTHALRLAKLREIYSEKETDIIRLARDPDIPTPRKQVIYKCLNRMCHMSASLFGELSSVPENYELIEQAAELDRALLELRSMVGSQISLRTLQAA